MKAKTAVFLGAFAALALAPLAARADLIYWMVNDPTEGYSHAGTATPVEFAYATISADGALLYAYNSSGKVDPPSPVLNALAGSSGTKTGAAYFGSFDSSVQSFLVELWSGDDELVGWQTYSASALAESIWQGDTPGGSGAKVLTVTEVVPEPSSGLMLLLGGVLLALRRRRAAC